MIEELEKAIRILSAIRRQLSGDHAAPPPSMQREVESGICLYCKKPFKKSEENRPRGLHERCYRKIMRLIEDSVIFEADAIEEGIIAPIRPAGRKPHSDPIIEKLKRKKHEFDATESLSVRESGISEAKSARSLARQTGIQQKTEQKPKENAK